MIDKNIDEQPKRDDNNNEAAVTETKVGASEINSSPDIGNNAEPIKTKDQFADEQTKEQVDIGNITDKISLKC